MEEKRSRLGVRNLEPVLTAGDDCGAGADSVTCAFLYTVLHEERIGAGELTALLGSRGFRDAGAVSLGAFRYHAAAWKPAATVGERPTAARRMPG